MARRTAGRGRWLERDTEKDGEEWIGTQEFLEMAVCWERLAREAAGRVEANIYRETALTRAKAKEKEMAVKSEARKERRKEIGVGKEKGKPESLAPLGASSSTIRLVS